MKIHPNKILDLSSLSYLIQIIQTQGIDLDKTREICKGYWVIRSHLNGEIIIINMHKLIPRYSITFDKIYLDGVNYKKVNELAGQFLIPHPLTINPVREFLLP